jgi:hypothetical protein
MGSTTGKAFIFGRVRIGHGDGTPGFESLVTSVERP